MKEPNRTRLCLKSLTQQTNALIVNKPQPTGRAQKIVSNVREANLINNDRRKRAATVALAKAALIAPVVASTDLAVEVAPAVVVVVVALAGSVAVDFAAAVAGSGVDVKN